MRCAALRYERLRRRDGAGRERKKKREREIQGVEWSRAEQSGSEVLINISPGFEARLN